MSTTKFTYSGIGRPEASSASSLIVITPTFRVKHRGRLCVQLKPLASVSSAFESSVSSLTSLPGFVALGSRARINLERTRGP